MAIKSSELSGFYRLGVEGRRARLADLTGMSEAEVEALSAARGLSDEQADHMAENVIGVIGLPLGLCVNLRVDGRDSVVPMVTEEPSVVAAASYAAKLLRTGGGVTTACSPPLMIGQVQVLDVPDPAAAERAICAATPTLLALANAGHPHLVAAGGGATEVHVKHLPPLADGDPAGPMLVVHLVVDVGDAMGANAVNSMCERIGARIEALSAGRVGLRILSNLADRRTVTARGRVPLEVLASSARSGRELAEAIVEASVFAERDPYRAATHNKGIMNGIDAVLLAFGQDWRAVEAGAHAFAARGGRYTALARWRIVDEALEGELTLPMAVGTVGGAAGTNPAVKVARRLASVAVAKELGSVAAAVGLAQNLGALRALASEGIQRGHMRLHARNLATEAGAEGDTVDVVAHQMALAGEVSLTAAKQTLKAFEARRREASRIPAIYRDGSEQALLGHFSELRQQYWPGMSELIGEVLGEATPEGSSLQSMCEYHLDTGGKRLRALLPLMVAEAMGSEPATVLAFGAACEMLHNATLVHDDLQDGDVVRRGHITVWRRFGVPQAINLGDAMFYYATLLCQRLAAPANRREAIGGRLMRDTLRVIDGQELEFSLKRQPAVTLDDYFAMVEGKTSGLFALPMAGAAELCGGRAPLVRGLEEVARHLGVLFQIQDDTLDLYGDKGRGQRGSDIAEGKRSALVVHAIEHGRADAVAELCAILDRDRDGTTERDIARALELLEEAGSRGFALAEIARRRAKALAAPALADEPHLRALVAGMCRLFVEPIDALSR